LRIHLINTENGLNKQLLAKQEEKQEERGSCQTLHGIDLKDWSFKIFFNFSEFTVA